VKGILADVNIQGQVRILVTVLETPAWREPWRSLNLPVRTLRDLGLAPDTSDAVVWQRCQEEQLVLVTGNRNEDGPDSLEATIRTHGPRTVCPS
jgi:hypothetical protein